MKQTDGYKAVEILTKEIKKYKGLFSLTDASRSTGLSIDEGKIFYSFERIKDELSEIKKLREKIKIDTGPGKIVTET